MQFDKTLTILIILILFFSCENENNKKLVNFKPLIDSLKKNHYLTDSVKLPMLYKSDKYSIELSPNPVYFELINKPIKDEIIKNYPISLSVIYYNRLVSLFDNNQFYCISLDNLERDTIFENLINKRNVDLHWILDDKLLIKSDTKLYFLDSNFSWIEYKEDFPIDKHSIMYNDSKYIVYSDCYGEFGGAVYFYNRRTKKTHFIKAVCANTVYKENDKYYILTSLFHEEGGSDLIEVLNPDELQILSKKNYHEQKIMDEEQNIVKKLFEFDNINFNSFFKLKNKRYFLTTFGFSTFISEMNKNMITIVNPLYNDKRLYIEPHTSQNGNYFLINFINGLGKRRENYCLIIKDKKIIMIDWIGKSIL